MSRVEFKKWLCQLSLFFHVDFKMVVCHMSNVRNGPCHVDKFFSHGDRLHGACRFKKNDHVALSNLRVNGHTSDKPKIVSQEVIKAWS